MHILRPSIEMLVSTSECTRMCARSAREHSRIVGLRRDGGLFVRIVSPASMRVSKRARDRRPIAQCLRR